MYIAIYMHLYNYAIDSVIGVCLSIHFYFRYIYGANYTNNIIIELFYMRSVDNAGGVQICGYRTPTTKWYLALEKEVNGCVNEYPKFIPESFIRVSE